MAAAGLLAAMLATRAIIWWPGGTGVGWRWLRNLPRFGYADIAVWGGMMAVFLVLASIARGRWRMGVASTYAGLALAQAVLAGVNVTAVFWLAGPITFQWLAYSDLGATDTARTTIVGAVDGAAIGALVLAIGAFAAGALALRGVLAQARHRQRPALAVLAVLAGGLVLYALRFGDPGVYLRGRTSNPLAEFVRTAWGSCGFDFEQAPPGDDQRYYQAGAGGAADPPAVGRRAAGPRPDILLVVLESVGELDLAGAGPLPALAAITAAGTRFDNAYVTAGSSTRSAFTIVSGRYPLFGYRQETGLLRDWPLASLPGTLQAAGYETAMMMGGDLDFSDLRGFIAGRGFDHLEDMTTIACQDRLDLDSKRWHHVGYISDRCLFDHFLRADAARVGPAPRPRFTILWNTATHFPYAPTPPGPAEPRARYRAALREADAQLGRVLDHLRATRRLASTLVIVIGDHGEAFLEHGNFSHGSTLFEEELHIPMIVAWPGHVAAGAHDRRLAHLVDLAPTIAGLAGLAPAADWQGLDLLGPVVRPRAYFIATQRDFLVGYREGNRKYVLDAGGDRLLRYDLDRDPLERRPIVPRAGEAATVRARLAGWAGYNTRLYRP